MELSRLPSLDLLRGFVAVGRRLSITLAAQDLYLTQSAVSRQVQALERQLGTRLLTRGHRAIGFTPEGEALFRSADAAIRQLQDAAAEAAARGAVRTVTVSTTIGFTALWLMPRLGGFQARQPRLDVRISAHNQVMDLRQGGIDLAVRYTTASQAPSGASLLFEETVVPVASPALRIGRLRGGRLPASVTLLEFEERYPWLRWQHWLASGTRQDTSTRRILHFNQYDLVIQAALAGQGVALGRRELVLPMLRDGRLVELAPPRPGETGGYGYWLVQAERMPRPDVGQVADWIRAEAALQRANGGR